MKALSSILRKPIKTICNLLILIAPLAIVSPYCNYVWGEPECPDLLKDSIASK